MAAKSSVYHCRAVTTYQCEDCLCNPASAPVYIGMKMQSVIVSLPDILSLQDLFRVWYTACTAHSANNTVRW